MRKLHLTLMLFFIGISQYINAQQKEVFTFETGYVGEFFNGLSGGMRTGSCYEGMLDLGITFNTENAHMWSGGEFYIQLENTHGNSPTGNYIGDLQVLSNIENGDYTYLYMLWYKQTLGKASLTLGVHDLNSLFVTTEYGGLFANSSFGIMPTSSMNVPVPIFPKNCMGAILELEATDKITINAALYDGDPGSIDADPHNMHLGIDPESGFLSTVEGIYSISANNYTKACYKLGMQYHTGEFTNFSDGETKDGNLNIYAIADQLVIDKGNGKGLGLFAQLGWAPSEYNNIPVYIGTGFNILGTLPDRGEDILGLGIAHAQVSEHLGLDENNETIVELSYNLQINESIGLQPDFQYIMNPGATSSIDDAFVGLLRINIGY